MADETQVTEPSQAPVVPESFGDEPLFTPQVDIIEKEDAILILADMPGVAKDSVDVVLEEGVLSINGKVRSDALEGMRLRSREYEMGNFHRCFSVGEGLDPDGVEAAMKDGVLRLSIPKAERYQPRRIEIKGQ